MGSEGYDQKAKVFEMRPWVGPQDPRCPPVPPLQECVLEFAEKDFAETKQIILAKKKANVLVGLW